MAINIMVNGLPGKMATEVAENILVNSHFELYPLSLTGKEITEDSVDFGKKQIKLIRSSERSFLIEAIRSNLLVVDYTCPNAVNENADFYCDNKLSFVMGTTGGDREALEQRVKDSDVCAVIAPNMAKQIVAFQAMMKYASKNFPNAFKGYNLEIVESHQKGKVDTSGTAKAMINYFNELGIPFIKNQIKMIREPKDQLKIGVPEEYLRGHGWHTYQLKSSDGDVFFQFTHNVNGRQVYADGTMDALYFLEKKVSEGNKGKVYSMIDVLNG